MRIISVEQKQQEKERRGASGGSTQRDALTPFFSYLLLSFLLSPSLPQSDSGGLLSRSLREASLHAVSLAFFSSVLQLFECGGSDASKKWVWGGRRGVASVNM